MCKIIKKIIIVVVVVALMSLCACSNNKNVGANSLIAVSGTKEAIVIEWKDETPEKAIIQYCLDGEETYKNVDNRLIRQLDESSARVDVLGLTKGKYEIIIRTGDGKDTIKVQNIEVDSYDRSGYAHFNYNQGIGAYDDSGKLKENAEIIYVNDNNKNTITYKSYIGICNILKNTDKFTKPLCIRVVGKISTRSWDEKDASYSTSGTPCNSTNGWAQNTMNFDAEKGITDLNGLMNRISIDEQNYIVNGTEKQPFDYERFPIGSSMTTYDSFFNVAESNNARNVTLEGVGEDAELFQWGIIWKKANSVEIRNLTFSDYPEDACSFYGNRINPDEYGNCWIHNCVFNRGVNRWDVTAPTQRDKYAGDGSTDITGCKNITVSYCKFNKCNKTGLIGSSDEDKQYNMTFHHNFYNECRSRLPLARYSNLHYYNNYNYKISNSCMNIRALAYAFSEGNNFENSKKTVATTLGSACKSFNDVFVDCTNGTSKIVSGREEIVLNSCRIGNLDYSTFDTDSTKFYYDEQAKQSKVEYLTSAEQAKTDCIENSGIALRFS